MADFSTEIQQFIQGGTYEYKFDAVGNLYFNSSSTDFSQVYLKLPLTNVVYDNSKIAKFYDPTFVEFVPTTGSVEVTSSVDALTQQLNIISQENSTMKVQLDNLIAQSNSTSNASDSQVVKQVILELRKALGQGRVDANFSDVFPYSPLTRQTTTPKI
jgi:hypothetical protein